MFLLFHYAKLTREPTEQEILEQGASLLKTTRSVLAEERHLETEHFLLLSMHKMVPIIVTRDSPDGITVELDTLGIFRRIGIDVMSNLGCNVGVVATNDPITLYWHKWKKPTMDTPASAFPRPNHYGLLVPMGSPPQPARIYLGGGRFEKGTE